MAWTCPEGGRGQVTKTIYDMASYRKKEDKTQSKITCCMDGWKSCNGGRNDIYGRELER